MKAISLSDVSTLVIITFMNIRKRKKDEESIYVYMYTHIYKFIEGVPELILFFSFNCEFFDQFRFDKTKLLIRKK